MKKIFTLIACAMAAMTSQAQITVTEEDGTVVNNGGTVTFHAVEEELGPGISIVTCDPQGPIIKNTSGATKTLKVKLTRTKESKLTWCGLTTSCQPVNSITETRSVTLKDGESRGLALHANFDSGVYATYSATAECTLGSDTFTFTTKFVYDDQTGIHGTTQSGTIALQGKALRYNLGNHSGMLSVFSTDGRRVESERISGQGVLSLGRLNSGVYLYEMTDNSGRKTTGKVFVK